MMDRRIRSSADTKRQTLVEEAANGPVYNANYWADACPAPAHITAVTKTTVQSAVIFI